MGTRLHYSHAADDKTEAWKRLACPRSHGQHKIKLGLKMISISILMFLLCVPSSQGDASVSHHSPEAPRASPTVPAVAHGACPRLRLGLPFGLECLPLNRPSPALRHCFLIVCVPLVHPDCESQGYGSHGLAAPCLAQGGHVADSQPCLLNDDLLLFPEAGFHVSGHRRLEPLLPPGPRLASISNDIVSY